MPQLDTLAYVDLETTGTHPAAARITQIAIVRTERFLLASRPRVMGRVLGIV